MKKLILTTLAATLGLVFLTGNITLALSNTDIDVNHAYQKDQSKYDLVTHEKAATDVAVYINDRNPVFTRANDTDWATFRGVDFEGTKGKVSFTIVFHEGDKTYQVPINYVRYYSISNGEVSFSKDNPDQIPVVVAPPVAPIQAPAPAATPSPQCTNGSYVSSNGNTVCSPEVSSSVPAGATAQCVDGTYSFSQHRQGTCSHHGGVANWL